VLDTDHPPLTEKFVVPSLTNAGDGETVVDALGVRFVAAYVPRVEALLVNTLTIALPLVVAPAPSVTCKPMLCAPMATPHPIVTGAVIDPLVLDKHVDRFRPGSRKFIDICEHYGISLTEAHNSGADALAAVRVTWEIASRYKEIGAMTLAELHTDQADWYRESRWSFAEYLRDTIAPKIRADATRLSAGERAVKLAELSELLARAELVDAGADGWPLRTAS